MKFTDNPNGIVESVQNPLGAITTFLRDQVNRLTTRIDALGNRFSLTYDINSRLIQTVNAVGAVIPCAIMTSTAGWSRWSIR